MVDFVGGKPTQPTSRPRSRRPGTRSSRPCALTIGPGRRPARARGSKTARMTARDDRAVDRHGAGIELRHRGEGPAWSQILSAANRHHRRRRRLRRSISAAPTSLLDLDLSVRGGGQRRGAQSEICAAADPALAVPRPGADHPRRLPGLSGRRLRPAQPLQTAPARISSASPTTSGRSATRVPRVDLQQHPVAARRAGARAPSSAWSSPSSPTASGGATSPRA